MKKLKLDLDQIQVVSFAVETAKGSGGTVEGFSPDTEIGCGGTGACTENGWSCRYCFPEPISEDTNCC